MESFRLKKEEFGIGLLCCGVIFRVLLLLLYFIIECGMGLEWFYDVKDIKKDFWVLLRRNLEDCIRKEKEKWRIKVKFLVY